MRTRFLLLSALTLLLMGTAVGGAVSARPQEGIRVAPNQPAEKEYPAMGPGAPTGAAVPNTPAACSSSTRTDCDTVPVEIIPPSGLDDDRDIFFTIIELHFDDSAGNDLDLHFYDNGQSSGSQEELATSASTKNPETVRVANADLEQYNLVIENFSGANTGYKIKARISTDPFQNPNESLAPDPPKNEEPEAEEEEEEEVVTPEDLSGGGDDTSAAAEDPTLAPVGDSGGDSDWT